MRLAEIQFFKANEEQDILIERGFKLLSNKVLDLFALVSNAGLNPDEETRYTLQSH